MKHVNMVTYNTLLFLPKKFWWPHYFGPGNPRSSGPSSVNRLNPRFLSQWTGWAPDEDGKGGRKRKERKEHGWKGHPHFCKQIAAAVGYKTSTLKGKGKRRFV